MARPVNKEEQKKRIAELDIAVSHIVARSEKLTYESISSEMGITKSYLLKKKNGEKNYLGRYVEEVMARYADYNSQFAALTETVHENLRLRRENKRLLASNKKLAEELAAQKEKYEALKVTLDTLFAHDFERRKSEIGKTG